MKGHWPIRKNYYVMYKIKIIIIIIIIIIIH